MFPKFLPPQQQLTEPAAIALAQRIERQAILTPLNSQAIATAYIHQGQGGTPILLLHGFDSSVIEFRYLLPLLANQNETWAVDLLGSGFTERVSGIAYDPPAIKTHLHCCWKLIDQPVILVGTSMGGAVAIDFALTYPEAVSQLVLINSMGLGGGFPLGQFLSAPFDALAVEFWRQRKLQALNLCKLFTSWDTATLTALQCAALHLEMPGWQEAMIAFTKSGGYLTLANQVAQIRQPTLILWGENDDTLGANDAEQFKQAIAHSQLIWLKHCGHAPHLEQPQIVAQHILEFSKK